ncbi:ABC transporter ATP-binding protein/permease [Pseudonocardia spinosispora]|uniref:ABC transporter ATP-binding protein/permease n=1 Tax=Pseudonocardia spinosispora TaxID=103441 RepID=UPI0006846850|nr:ABC transporter ATP-binding protein/permease [Pseudonocardia spinosispora]
MDWPDEWLLSLSWTLKVSVVTLVVLALSAASVMKFTGWGRNFKALTLSHFIPGRSWASWQPILSITAVLVLAIVGVRLQVLDSYFQNGLYTAFQKRDASQFYRYMGIFGFIAAVNVVQVMLSYFLGQLLVIRWRVWLTNEMLTDWMTDRSYHVANFLPDAVDNPDQRIQEDINSFTSNSQDLLLGAVSAIISTCSFVAVLWTLSGPMSVFGFQVPRAMTFAILIYVTVASVVVFKVAHPLIRLNFVKEALAASFRYALVRLRDNSESVAFYSGERVERRNLDSGFRAVIGNAWDLVHRNVKLNGLNIVVTQLSVVIPFILQAPRFFSGAVSLGDMQQTASAMGQVHDSLSFFRNNYDTFATYRATIDRLIGLKKVNAQARKMPTLSIGTDRRLDVRRLTINLPTGQPLIEDLTFTLGTGDTLLVKGPSGCGKTTLLRALAGLWPYADGQVRRPTGTQALFLSQRPYLPLGTLRQSLYYPEDTATDSDPARGVDILHRVQLGHLAERIDEPRDWGRILSPGEQQRLGFARILLNRPRIAFLDEATSAMDAGIELMLYRLLRDDLPECTIVSVAHHHTLESVHTNHLDLSGSGGWALSEISGTVKG